MSTLRFAMSCAILIAAYLFLRLGSYYEEPVSITRPLKDLPTAIGSWRIQESSPFDEAVLDILKPTDYVNLRYADPRGRNLWLYIGYWDSQRKGTRPHSPKLCLPGSGWEPVQTSRLAVPLAPPHMPITVNSYLVQKDRDQQLVLYWYQSGTNVNAAEMSARLQMVKNSIFHHRSDGAIVRISGPIYGSVRETTELLVGYARDLYPILLRFLPP